VWFVLQKERNNEGFIFVYRKMAYCVSFVSSSIMEFRLSRSIYVFRLSRLRICITFASTAFFILFFFCGKLNLGHFSFLEVEPLFAYMMTETVVRVKRFFPRETCLVLIVVLLHGCSVQQDMCQ
jgi:hypothetical protein